MALSSNRDNVNGNWLKALWALELTKQGLRSYVTNTFEYLHKRIYSSIERAHRLSADVTCGDFRTENVVPCPTQDLCKREKCENHNTPDKSPRPCPAQLCDAVKDEIATTDTRNQNGGTRDRSCGARTQALDHGSWRNVLCRTAIQIPRRLRPLISTV